MDRQPPLNFTSDDERRKWFTDNADYFTVIRSRNLKNERQERPTLAEAMAEANRIIEGDPTARLLIYAVYGSSDSFVAAVHA